MLRSEIYREPPARLGDTHGEYRWGWRLLSDDEKVVAYGVGYKMLADGQAAIELARGVEENVAIGAGSLISSAAR